MTTDANLTADMHLAVMLRQEVTIPHDTMTHESAVYAIFRAFRCYARQLGDHASVAIVTELREGRTIMAAYTRRAIVVEAIDAWHGQRQKQLEEMEANQRMVEIWTTRVGTLHAQVTA